MISFHLNGKLHEVDVPGDTPVLWVLRDTLGLTGTKFGCGISVCGACTVLVDGRPMSSCNYLAFEAHGRSVLTIEGVAQDDQLDPLQEAFIRNIGAQCGYCTPGQIMAAKALLTQTPRPTPEQVKQGLDGYLCRCGTHTRILHAVLRAAKV